MRRLILLIGALLAVVMPAASAWAQTTTNDAAAQKAAAYIRTQQAPDGTFAGFGAGSTADAIYALAAANLNIAELKTGGASPIDGLSKLAPEAAKDPGVAAKFVIAALLAGQSPTALGGTDMVAAVESGFNAATGQYGKDVTAHVLALLALRAAGATVRPEAVAALEKLQLPDGGWSFDGTPATGSDTNTTSLAIQALTAAGSTTDARTKALDYLRAQQNPDGGFPYSQTSQFGNASDANSTALGVQAILASGETLDAWAKAGKTPVDRLLAFQNPSGAFRFQDAQPEDNQLATYQAIPAITGKPFPTEPILTALAPSAQTAEPATTTGEGSGLPAAGRGSRLTLPLLVAGLLLLAGLALRRRSA
ncbi:MAG TPA: prenyltransferase/squalene oxidase repeat-containing protein [Herpetosiphonaceae bacterium]|nr:prenyltransferase/squalene oxidase repeat-containing protein [Herpetosiphonaceae bacterium]